MIDLATPQRVHIVGVGGAAMSAIASILASLGHEVTGSDNHETAVTARLRASGIPVMIGHAPDNVPEGASALAVSTAIPASNPEVVAARERAIPVLARAEVLAAICGVKRTIAVAGTHGKTTTTSMVALVLAEAGFRPSFLVGGQLNRSGSGVAWTDSEWFVVEADESDGTFLQLGAEAVLVTSVEADHLDFYGSVAAIEEAFETFLTGTPGPRVACADDPVAARLARQTGAVTYGAAADADVRMVDVRTGRSSASFTVVRGGERLGEVSVPVPGEHNAQNACGALTLAMELGVPFDVAAAALARYGGVSRRFEFRGERGGVTFVDDYAHNPGKVRAALAAAKAGGWARVVAVFQPHLYSRTADLAADFGRAFGDADVVIVTDVYGAREQPRPGVTGKLIVDAILEADPAARVVWLPGRADLARQVPAFLRPGDLCITLGAGDITFLPDEILAGP